MAFTGTHPEPLASCEEDAASNSARGHRTQGRRCSSQCWTNWALVSRPCALGTCRRSACLEPPLWPRRLDACGSRGTTGCGLWPVPVASTCLLWPVCPLGFPWGCCVSRVWVRDRSLSCQPCPETVDAGRAGRLLALPSDYLIRASFELWSMSSPAGGRNWPWCSACS